MGVKNLVTGHLANISTYTNTGDITALTVSGNITGSYILGNGSQLSGLPQSYGNANVAAYLPTYTGNLVSLAGNVTTTANISGAYILGNGSGLTGLNPGIAITNGTSNVNISSANGPINFVYAGNTAGSITANSVSLGAGAGIGQGANAVSVGTGAGVSQSAGAVAIGANAGLSSQGTSAIAIGQNAGTVSQPSNSIFLNASGTALNGVNAGFYVNPVRQDLANVTQEIYYNTATKELTYSPSWQALLSTTTYGTYGGNVITSATVGAGSVLTPTVASAGTTLTLDPGNDGLSTTGNVVVNGNLQVQGNLTYASVTAATTANLVWQAANNASSASQANGGGLAVGPANTSYATFLYSSSTNSWNSNLPLNVSGNIIAGNITTTGAVGNISGVNYYLGNYFVGNGIYLTGISATYLTNGSSNVAIPVANGPINFNVFNQPVGYVGTTNTSFGFQAGSISQGLYGAAYGYQAGLISQGANSVAIGAQAAGNTQGQSAVAIGSAAGYLLQGTNSIAIGTGAALSNQNARSIAIGINSAGSAQSTDAIAIGNNAGNSSQSAAGIAIGLNAGQTTQGTQSVAIGSGAGTTIQGTQAVAIGLSAASTSQGTRAIAIGQLAGNSVQGSTAVAIGFSAGAVNQGANSVAIGQSAGSSAIGADSVAIGTSAGAQTGSRTVAIGAYSGQTAQQGDGVAVGWSSGQTNQGVAATALGWAAGQNTQGAYTVAVGHNAGTTTQGQSAVAIGSGAGIVNQGSKAIAIGDTAGGTNQGQNAIAIGYYAGNSSQASNSIVINASGFEHNNNIPGSLQILPLRDVVADNSTTNPVQAMYYNNSTSEVSYSPANMYSAVFPTVSGGGLGTNTFGAAIQISGSTTLPSTSAPVGTKLNFYANTGTVDVPIIIYAYTAGGGFIYCGQTSYNSITLYLGETLELTSRGSSNEWDITGGTAGLRYQGYQTNNTITTPIKSSLGPDAAYNTWCYLDDIAVRFGNDGKVYWKMTNGSTVEWSGCGWTSNAHAQAWLYIADQNVGPSESEIANTKNVLLSETGSMWTMTVVQRTPYGPSTRGTYRITVVKSNIGVQSGLNTGPDSASIVIERLW